MSCRITILCDNTVGSCAGTLGEHGFAAFVDCGAEALLFDTGGGHTLLHNAQRMHIDLRRVDRVVLSHGHYDHTGGLWTLLQSCGPKEVLAHPEVFSSRYVARAGERKSIGIPYAKDFLVGAGASFTLSADFKELAPGVFLTGEVPRSTPFEQGDDGLCCDAQGCHPDLVPDDQSLVLATPKGLVLLLGCCHAGVVNTIEHARARTGVQEVYAVVGGCHLAFSKPAQLEGTVQALKRLGVRRICGGHCTGFAPSARLHREFPGAFRLAQVGYTIECG